MVVNVDHIRDEGLTLDEPLSLSFLNDTLKDSAGFTAREPSTLHAQLNKVSGSVLLKGKFKLDVGIPCKRCLAPAALSLPVDFTLNLIPTSLARGDDYLEEGEDDEKTERAGSFDLKDADQETFEGKQIELDPIVREQVLLALPMDSLCKEDCKGLCAQCGQNLNEAQCSCDPKPLDPRLAALKNIKLKPQA